MLADYNGVVVALLAEIRVCEKTPACDSTPYFGHVRNFCGQAAAPTRPRGHPDPLKPSETAKVCKENTEYPVKIINELRPKYAAWLPPGI